MRPDALPLTYGECRERFRQVARHAHAPLSPHPISALGPAGEELTVDVATVGADRPRRALVVMSGVHGVEGFVSSAIQCDLLTRLDAAHLASDIAVVLVHAVNPWGMAWWRRQNECNVDLNRNWGRDSGAAPPANDGYDELHPLLCPATAELPTAESFLEPMRRVIDEHGIAWVRAAVSGGQYTHPDGLYYGGATEEESTAILRRVVDEHLAGARRSLIVDLHTGHGAAGTYTLLSPAPLGSPADEWIRTAFDAERVEATVGDPTSTSAPKTGQLMAGMSAMLAAEADVDDQGDRHIVTFELGTVSNTTMILAERAEHWVHRHGDRRDPRHAAAVWHHRACSTPDDPAWERTALAHGRDALDAALAAMSMP